jgi:transposase
MEMLVERVCGLDVHRDEVSACARTPSVKHTGARVSTQARFMTHGPGLSGLVSWLSDLEVSLVAMEATGVYWRPVFYALEEAGIDAVLVNAAHIKNVPGRKTDTADAAWICQLAEHGLLRASFIPPPEIRALRELCRYRKSLIQERGRVIQRLEKICQDAAVKLTSVASVVLTKTGRAIIESLIAGERDPEVLADLARGRLRPRVAELEQALAHRWQPHHTVIARAGLAHLDALDTQIANVSVSIVAAREPFEWAMELLCTIPGIDLRSAETIISEIGVDMTAFPTAGHLASWAGMCPGNNESAGKHGPGWTRPGAPWLRQGLIEVAHAVARTKNNHLAERHRRIRTRRGPKRAAVATGHAVLVAVWHILERRTPFHNLGVDYNDRRRDPTIETRRLIARLEHLGHHVTITPAA